MNVELNGVIATVVNVILLAVLAVCFAFVLYCLFPFFSLVEADGPIQLLWDMAYHGFGGAIIAADIQSLSLLHLIADTLAQQDYPFGGSYLLAIFMILFGDSAQSAAVASYCFFVLTGLIMFMMMQELLPSGNRVAGILVALLPLTSPLYLAFSFLIMLEIFGTFFTLLSLTLYVHAQKTLNQHYFIGAFVAATLVFFIKYNYGLILIAVLGVIELYQLPASIKRCAVTAIKRGFRSRAILSLSNGLVVLLVVLLLSIILTQGYEFTFWGRKIALYKIQNPAYVLVFVVLVKSMRAFRRHKNDITADVTARFKVLLWWTFLPVSAWLLLPGNLDSVIDFSINRTSDYSLLSLDNLLYYVEALNKDYCIMPVVFSVFLLFYLLSLLSIRSESFPIKLFHAYFLLSFVMVTIHPHKASRFIFTAVPIFWLVAVAKIGAVLKKRPFNYILPTLMLGLLLLFGNTFGQSLKNLYHYDFYSRTAHWFCPFPPVRAIIERIMVEAQKPGRIAVIGSCNEISPRSLQWNFLRKRITPERPVEFDFKAKELTKLATIPIDRILVVEIRESSPYYSKDYRLYNAWKQESIDAVTKSPDYALKETLFLASSQIKLSIFARTPGTGGSPD